MYLCILFMAPNINVYRNVDVKIACWNIQGLSDDKCKEKCIVDYIANNDCSIFLETWLNNPVKFDNVYTYCLLAEKSVKGRSKGGITIILKNNVKKGVKILEHVNSHIVWLKFDKKYFSLDNDVFGCIIYMPPSISLKDAVEKQFLWDSIEDGILKYSMLGDIFILGDLNSRTAKMNEMLETSKELDMDDNCFAFDDKVSNRCRNSEDENINQFGRRLIDMCRHTNMLILNGRKIGDIQGRYTCHHYNGSSTVDYCIVNKALFTKVIYFKVMNPSHISDHCALSVCFNSSREWAKTCDEKSCTQFPLGFKWNDSEVKYRNVINSSQFMKRCENICENIYNNDSDGINWLCDDISSVLTDAAQQSLVRRKIKKREYSKNKWYSPDLVKLKNNILYTGKLLRKFPRDPHIRGKFIVRKKLYKQACRNSKKNYVREISHKLDTLENKSTKQYWSLLNSLKCPKFQEDAATYNIPMEKFVEKFKSVYQNSKENISVTDREINNVVKQVTAQIGGINTLDNPVKSSELSKCISELKNGKAFGEDLILNEMLRTSIKIIEKPLLRLFNICLDSGIYPDAWCKGYIVPILKYGDNTEVNNYRPVTISSCLGKIFSSILNKRLSAFLEDHNIIPACQIGFSKKHRTSDHILLLKAIIDAYKRQRKHVYSCFIDFAAAFDSVWHAGLIYKLYHCGVSNKIVKLLHNMYGKLQCCIKNDFKVSEYFNVYNGTRQGCNMSPTLFKLFLSDIEKCFENPECNPVTFGSTKIGCLLYADDLLILSQGACGLQTSLNNLHDYCQKWHLEINIKKTKIMIFNSKKHLQVFKIGNSILEQTERTCYLGFMLTPSGKFKSTVKYLYDKACKAFFLLKLKYKLLPYLSVKTKIKLFDTMIVPILLYGSEVWGAYLVNSPNSKEKILNYMKDCKHLVEKLHSKFCKQTLCVNKTSCNYAVRLELGRLPLYINIICRVLNYFYNVVNRGEKSIVNMALMLHKCNNTSWYTFIENILEYTGFNINNFSKYCIKKSYVSIFRKLKTKIEEIYLSKIVEGSRLKLYSQIKRCLTLEKYLTVCDPSVCKYVTKIRISSHKLPIETGRYKNIQPENRLCSLCKFKIGNEFHCIMECLHPTVTQIRNVYLHKIFNINAALKSFPRNTLFLYIMSFKDTSLINVTAKYIKDIIETYENN